MVIKASAVVKEIAQERISILYELAKKEDEQELSRRYIRLARRISRHYKIKLDKKIKTNICRKCNSVLVPGKTVTVRLASSKGYIIYKCLNCGSENHIYY